jgi:hypothetical protein
MLHTYKFTEHHRLRLALVLGKLDDLVDRWVHSRVHVHRLGVDVCFVVDGSAVIVRFDVVIHGLEVPPVEGFVTQTPGDDRRMQLITLHQMFSTINIGFGPIWVVCSPFGRFASCQELAFSER